MTDHDTAAAHLVDLYDAMWRQHNVNARRAQEHTLRGRDLDAALDADEALREACEAFRRTHHPRAGLVFVGGREVYTVGPSRATRTCRRVFKAAAAAAL